MLMLLDIVRVGQSYDTEDQGHSKESIQSSVEGVPKTKDVVAGLVELDDLIADVAKSEYVKRDFGAVKNTCRVY